MASPSLAPPGPRSRPSRAVIGFGIGIALSAIAWMGLAGARAPAGSERTAGIAAASPAEARAAAPLPRSVPDLQDHLRQNPDDWRAWAALGVGYVDEARATGNPSLYPKAQGALDRSMALRPDGNVAALAGRGALANARHDFAAGLRFADEAAGLDGADPRVAAVRGDALIELGRYDEAFDAYQILVDLAPGIAAYTRSAYALELQGDVAGAERSLQLALGEAFTPQDLAFAQFSLGELAWNRGDLGAARQHYAQAVAADPAAVGPQAGLARLDAAAGAVERAVTGWRSVIERAPLPEYVGELVNLYEATGRRAEARPQLELLDAQRALLAVNGVNGDLELALFSADHGIELDRGLAAAEADFGRRQGNIHAADALAWQLHAHGRHTEALAHADRALRLGTPNALFHFHRGVIRQALGDSVGARQDLGRALALNPHFSTLHAPTARGLTGAAGGAR